MKPLKEQTKDELISNYRTLVKWTIEREVAKTPKGKAEYAAGVQRIIDYEIELSNYGITGWDLRELYSSYIFDGEVNQTPLH